MARGFDELNQAGKAGADGRQAPADAGEGTAPRSQLELRLERLPAGHPSSPGYLDRKADDSGARAARPGEATEVAGGPARPDGPAPPGEPPPDGPRAGYAERTPEFELMWSWHEQRWPQRPEADRERPGDLPGWWHGDGGRALNPERNGEADRQIAAMRSHEKGITETLKRIEQDNTSGAKLVGLEHRMKGDDRIREKICDKTRNLAGITVANAAEGIKDAVRYTFRLDPDSYARGYADVKERLESAGCRMTYGKNHWVTDPEYKGVNTQWVAPDGGRFELGAAPSE